MSRTYYCGKSQVYELNLRFHYEKSSEIGTCPIASLNAQLKVNISEGYVGETKMMADFETIYKIIKPFPN